MSDIDAAVVALLRTLEADLLRRDLTDPELHAERDAVCRMSPRPRTGEGVAAPHRAPACRHLDDALALGAAGAARELVEAIRPLSRALRWNYGYAFELRWPDLANNVAFAQIVGGRGLMTDDSVQIGLTLMAPATLYPPHAHPAIETYLVVAGTAAWRVEREPFAAQAPGALILHRSGVAHAMATSREPLLALYTWRGDLVTPPVYVDEPGA